MRSPLFNLSPTTLNVYRAEDTAELRSLYYNIEDHLTMEAAMADAATRPTQQSSAETMRQIMMIKLSVITELALEHAANAPLAWNVGDWEAFLGALEMVKSMADAYKDF